MVKSRAGNNQFLKKYNQTVILDMIRLNKAVSRAELSQKTGLSPTAIGAIVSSLTEAGYIHEVGAGESTGGRRPVMLELKPESYFSVGVDLEVGFINAVLMDITGETISEKQAVNPCYTEYAATAKAVAKTVREMLGPLRVDSRKLLGMGISVPGMVDNETHNILFAPNLGWRNVDIRAELGDFDGIPVYVENEAMASAICENWIGSCQGVSNFVCVNSKSGIGAGIFTHGMLYRGAGGSAGEVGHIQVDDSGPRCACGNYGCLEALASAGRIVDNARRLVRQGTASSLNDTGDAEDITMDDVINAARNGDEAARAILLEAARYLGIALSSIVNTLNPAKIVIGKEFTRYSDIVLEQIKGIVAGKALKPAAECVEIISSGFGERASTLGAAIIPLKVLFGR